MITYPIQWPVDLIPATISHRHIDSVARAMSSTSFVSQAQRLQGAVWEVTMEWTLLDREEGLDLSGLIGSLSTNFGCFLMPIPDLSPMPGLGGGTPLVDGTNTVGARSLKVKGLPTSQPGTWKRGGVFSLPEGAANHRLHQVLQDVDTDANGDAVVEIWPPLRQAYAGDEIVTLDDPQGTWELVDVPDFTASQVTVYGLAITAREHLSI